MANVGIVIVSHSSKVAEGAADMVRQMVGTSISLAWTGGNADDGLGTDVGKILESINRAWSDAGVASAGHSPSRQMLGSWSWWLIRPYQPESTCRPRINAS